MINQQITLTIIENMSREMGVKIVTEVNVYLQPSVKKDLEDVAFKVFIDPSGFNNRDEESITRYAEVNGLRVEETWNDWGRFLSIVKLIRMS